MDAHFKSIALALIATFLFYQISEWFRTIRPKADAVYIILLFLVFGIALQFSIAAFN